MNATIKNVNAADLFGHCFFHTPNCLAINLSAENEDKEQNKK